MGVALSLTPIPPFQKKRNQNLRPTNLPPFFSPSFLSIVDVVTHTMGMVGVAEGEKRGKIQFS